MLTAEDKGRSYTLLSHHRVDLFECLALCLRHEAIDRPERNGAHGRKEPEETRLAHGLHQRLVRQCHEEVQHEVRDHAQAESARAAVQREELSDEEPCDGAEADLPHARLASAQAK